MVVRRKEAYSTKGKIKESTGIKRQEVLHRPKKKRKEMISFLGLVFIIIGALYTLRNIVPEFSLWLIMPVVMLLYGVFLLFKKTLFIGTIIVLASLMLFTQELFLWQNWSYIWPVILMLFGVYLILKKLK